MSKHLKVAVLGAGNGGQAMGGWMASRGCARPACNYLIWDWMELSRARSFA